MTPDEALTVLSQYFSKPFLKGKLETKVVEAFNMLVLFVENKPEPITWKQLQDLFNKLLKEDLLSGRLEPFSWQRYADEINAHFLGEKK